MNPQLFVDFDAILLLKILHEGGIPAWNQFVEDLFDRNLVSTSWSSTERPPPFVVYLDFSQVNLDGMTLDGIKLSSCNVQNACFDRTSLRGARMGFCTGASFRGAQLDGCDFSDLSLDGCDFTDALGLETALFDGSIYELDNPPFGIPPQLLSRCNSTKIKRCEAPVDLPETESRNWVSRNELNCQASVLFLSLEENDHEIE